MQQYLLELLFEAAEREQGSGGGSHLGLTRPES
jgi:hypothetical protein